MTIGELRELLARFPQDKRAFMSYDFCCVHDFAPETSVEMDDGVFFLCNADDEVPAWKEDHDAYVQRFGPIE